MKAIEAPQFFDLAQAREWVSGQSLAEVFYLVEPFPNLFEFWSLANIAISGGLEAFRVIEVWS